MALEEIGRPRHSLAERVEAASPLVRKVSERVTATTRSSVELRRRQVERADGIPSFVGFCFRTRSFGVCGGANQRLSEAYVRTPPPTEKQFST